MQAEGLDAQVLMSMAAVPPSEAAQDVDDAMAAPATPTSDRLQKAQENLHSLRNLGQAVEPTVLTAVEASVKALEKQLETETQAANASPPQPLDATQLLAATEHLKRYRDSRVNEVDEATAKLNDKIAELQKEAQALQEVKTTVLLNFSKAAAQVEPVPVGHTHVQDPAGDNDLARAKEYALATGYSEQQLAGVPLDFLAKFLAQAGLARQEDSKRQKTRFAVAPGTKAFGDLTVEEQEAMIQ